MKLSSVGAALFLSLQHMWAWIFQKGPVDARLGVCLVLMEGGWIHGLSLPHDPQGLCESQGI